MSTHVRVECDRIGCAEHRMARSHPESADAAVRKARKQAQEIGWMCDAGNDTDYCPACTDMLKPVAAALVACGITPQEAPRTQEDKNPGVTAAFLCEFCERATPFFDMGKTKNREAAVALLNHAGWAIEEAKSGYLVAVCPCCHTLPEGVAEVMSEEIKELNATDPRETTYFPH